MAGRPAVRLASLSMRLVVARCTVDLSGRLSAHLPEALRPVMIKGHGSVMARRHPGLRAAE